MKWGVTARFHLLCTLLALGLLTIAPSSFASGHRDSSPNPNAAVLQAFADVRIQVDALDIGAGNHNSLESKIDGAEGAYLRGQSCTAANKLRALQHQVRALLKSDRLVEPTLLYYRVTAAYEALLIHLPNDTRCGGHEAPVFTVSIDSQLVPPQPQLPPLDGTTARPLAALADASGRSNSFVANELVVSEQYLDHLLTNWGGEVLREINPADAGLGLPRYLVVRINTTLGNPGGLADDIVALNEPAGRPASGQWRVSSVQGLQMLAAAASLAREGVAVELNFVAWPDAIPDSTEEAPGCSGCALQSPYPHEPDAYLLKYYRRGGALDIGVAEAWSMLHWSNRLVRSLPLAVLDVGFTLDVDLPGTSAILSIDPENIDPIGVPGSGISPWHGRSVASIAMSIPDNNKGVAGVAGSVAQPIYVFIGNGVTRGATAAAMVAAYAAGAQIMNMSFSGDIPWWLGWMADSMDAVTGELYNQGRLLFASAGNDGSNIDREICSDYLPICWEEYARWPCESNGVICVGGIVARRDLPVMRDPASAWGNSSVDIWAPFSVFVLDYHPTYGSDSQVAHGTSLSTPFTAGIAALVWSGNPALDNRAVWSLLQSTAHGAGSLRWVNAYGAVLGSDLPHTVEIVHPEDDSTHEQGHPVSLCAEVRQAAPSGDDLTADVLWTASVLGTVGDPQTLRSATVELTSFTDGLDRERDCLAADLPQGRYRIDITTTAEGRVRADRIAIKVQNSPPEVSLYQPGSSIRVCAGEAVNFRATGSDANEVLPEHSFAWSSNQDGALGTGLNLIGVRSLSVGLHNVSVTVTDSDGLTASDHVDLEVLAGSDTACNGAPLRAEIASPTTYTPGGYCHDWDGSPVALTLKANTTDNPENALYSWSSDHDGLLGEGSLIEAQLNAEHTCGAVFLHTITLEASDSAGTRSAHDSIQVCLTTPGC